MTTGHGQALPRSSMPNIIARSGSDRSFIAQVAKLALRGLDPGAAARRPAFLALELATVAATALFCLSLVSGNLPVAAFIGQVALWLWIALLVISAGVATLEAHGMARARRLRALQSSVPAKSLIFPLDLHHDDLFEVVASEELRVGDVVLVKAGDIIPADGEVIDGVAEVDESAVTGESAPVIRESGGDRSAVICGTRVISDQLKVRVTAEVGHSFFERMIELIVETRRRASRAELWFTVPLLVCAGFVVLAAAGYGAVGTGFGGAALLVALFAALLPTATAGLRSIAGIAGVNGLVAANMIAKSGTAVEAAARVDTLLLDKTGTITLGNRTVEAILPLPGVLQHDAVEAAFYASLCDETPEGRSIVEFARRQQSLGSPTGVIASSEPFTADSRMSGIVLADGTDFHKGEPTALLRRLEVSPPQSMTGLVERVARSGGTPLVVSRDREPMGVVHLTDAVRAGMSEQCAELRGLGVRTVMVTGDNPLTAATVAAEAGVDDYLAEATPQAKLAAVREEQARGRRVGVCGDGTNDAPALAQAELGIALSHGSAAALEAGNMIDLDSDPMKLIRVIQAARRLAAVRRTLTGLALGSDIGKFVVVTYLVFLAGSSAGDPLQVTLLAGNMFAVLVALPLLALAMLARNRPSLPITGQATKSTIAAYGAAGMLTAPLGIGVLQVVITALGLA